MRGAIALGVLAVAAGCGGDGVAGAATRAAAHLPVVRRPTGDESRSDPHWTRRVPASGSSACHADRGSVDARRVRRFHPGLRCVRTRSSRSRRGPGSSSTAQLGPRSRESTSASRHPSGCLRTARPGSSAPIILTRFELRTSVSRSATSSHSSRAGRGESWPSAGTPVAPSSAESSSTRSSTASTPTASSLENCAAPAADRRQLRPGPRVEAVGQPRDSPDLPTRRGAVENPLIGTAPGDQEPLAVRGPLDLRDRSWR